MPPAGPNVAPLERLLLQIVFTLVPQDSPRMPEVVQSGFKPNFLLLPRDVLRGDGNVSHYALYTRLIRIVVTQDIAHEARSRSLPG